MFGPTPVSGCAAIMRSPMCSMAMRSMRFGSLLSNIETKRCWTLLGDSAKNIAAMTGSTATRRKSRSAKSSATAAHTPTSALRVNVSATANASAGITSADHKRPDVPNSSRATATAIAIISRPENVM